MKVHTIDLNFQGLSGAIAVYLIPHANGAALVECGPGSTLPALEKELNRLNLSPRDITDVLLTHIHLDHAGAAGWFANQGAKIHVHPVGAPHLISPEKLLDSAARIYGEWMEPLWGEFLPVPEERLSIVNDGGEVRIGNLCFRALDTPGHASHHYAYIFENICFSGDIGGVRVGNMRHLRLPMPPPEFNLEKWRESLDRLKLEFQSGSYTRIAPTHFGIYEDVSWHLDEISRSLDDVEAWMESHLPAAPDMDALRLMYTDWLRETSLAKGVDPDRMNIQEAANPSFMSADGISRYWRKYRQ